MTIIGIIVAAILWYIVIMWIVNFALNISEYRDELHFTLNSEKNIVSKILPLMAYILISIFYFLGIAIIAFYVASLLNGGKEHE